MVRLDGTALYPKGGARAARRARQHIHHGTEDRQAAQGASTRADARRRAQWTQPHPDDPALPAADFCLKASTLYPKGRGQRRPPQPTARTPRNGKPPGSTGRQHQSRRKAQGTRGTAPPDDLALPAVDFCLKASALYPKGRGPRRPPRPTAQTPRHGKPPRQPIPLQLGAHPAPCDARPAPARSPSRCQPHPRAAPAVSIAACRATTHERARAQNRKPPHPRHPIATWPRDRSRMGVHSRAPVRPN